MSWRTYALVFVTALALRAAWGFYRMSSTGAAALEFPDEEQYWLMGTSLREGRGLRDELDFRATRMPLYPGLLALAAGRTHGLVYVRIAQWVIGACGAVLIAMLGARVGGQKCGVIAGVLFALDPFLVFFSSLILSETLFVTLLVGLYAYLEPFVAERREPRWRQWVVIACLSTACVYARESTLGLIGLGGAVYLAVRRFEPAAWRGILIVGLGLILGLAPWAVRNRRVIGEWRWLTTRGGISLYDGVRPAATGAGDLGEVKQSQAVRGLSEVEWDRYFTRESFRQIREQPGRIAGLALRKFVRMWNPVPNVDTYRSPLVRLVSAAWMIPLLLLALMGAFRGPRVLPGNAAAIVMFLLLPAIYLSLLHMIFIGSVRYRLGAIPMLAVLAAMALERWPIFRPKHQAVSNHA